MGCVPLLEKEPYKYNKRRAGCWKFCHSKRSKAQIIEFDIAVTVSNQSDKSTSGKVNVFALNASGQMQNSHHVSFDVKLALLNDDMIQPEANSNVYLRLTPKAKGMGKPVQSIYNQFGDRFGDISLKDSQFIQRSDLEGQSITSKAISKPTIAPIKDEVKSNRNAWIITGIITLLGCVVTAILNTQKIMSWLNSLFNSN